MTDKYEAVLYRELSMDELVEKQAGITARLAELEPVLMEQKDLTEDEEWVQLAMSKYRVEKGEPLADDLWKLKLFASSQPELHQSLQIWLARVTASQQISLAPDEDNERGSSDFYFAPFIIDLTEGLKPDLAEDVKVTSSAFTRNRRDDKTVYRFTIDLYLIITLQKNEDGVLTHAAYVSVGDHYMFAKYNDEETMTIPDALLKVESIMKKNKLLAKENMNADGKLNGEPRKKRLFGMF